MTFFGKNIKKIRSVKKLSQTAFGELFGLTRASVGAYEEERADPKLDAVIQIANYFSISIDELLNKELTINDLFHFNILDKELQQPGNLKPALIQPIDTSVIPVINWQEFFMQGLEKNPPARWKHTLTLPLTNSGHPIALQVGESTKLTNNSSVETNDFIVLNLEHSYATMGNYVHALWFFMLETHLYLGNIQQANNDELSFFTGTDLLFFKSSDPVFIHPVVQIISNGGPKSKQPDERIQRLELMVNELYRRQNK